MLDKPHRLLAHLKTCYPIFISIYIANTQEILTTIYTKTDSNSTPMSSSSSSNDIVSDLSPYIRVYKDGTVERLFSSPFVPPSLNPENGGVVSSKDIKISSEVSARLYLPLLTDDDEKLPILVYYHAGGFCLESAFSLLHHRYLNLFVSQGKFIAVSVEYRLAPENPLPAAFQDSWTALQWVASHHHHPAAGVGNVNQLIIIINFY